MKPLKFLRRISLGGVPKYVQDKYQIKLCWQTAYNWASIGKRGIKLRTVSKRRGLDLVLVTTNKWIDEFIAASLLVL